MKLHKVVKKCSIVEKKKISQIKYLISKHNKNCCIDNKRYFSIGKSNFYWNIWSRTTITGLLKTKIFVSNFSTTPVATNVKQTNVLITAYCIRFYGMTSFAIWRIEWAEKISLFRLNAFRKAKKLCGSSYVP